MIRIKDLGHPAGRNLVLRQWNPLGDDTLLYEFLPKDTSHQTHSLREALMVLNDISCGRSTVTLLDLGCGSGESYDSFCGLNGKVRWIGLDIPDSPEASQQPRRALPFCTYDGIRIPLADNSVDIAYSRQVFEHVWHPELLLSETHRILKPGGFFVGSTSHLEPFHSRSFWNYTPYGFCLLLRDAAFHSIQVRPGIDSLTLIGRRFLSHFGLAGIFERFFKSESPLNLALEWALHLLGQTVERRNAFKLLYSGHFCFFARK